MKHIKRIACILIAVVFAASSVCALETSQVSAASKPAQVKSLTVKLADKKTKKIKLSWKKANRASKYQVYIKAPGAKWKRLKTIKARSTTYKAAKAGKYYFKVRGIKSTQKGKFSAVKSITLSKKLWETEKEPAQPTDPTNPTDPTQPTEPTQPTDPTEPSEPAQVPVTKIVISGNTTLYPGESTTLTATVYPANATQGTVHWTGSKYAEKSGKASGNRLTITTTENISPGTFTIKASARDDSGVYATCKITVKEKPTGLTNPIRGLKLINQHPIYDDSIPSISGISQDKIDNLFKLDDYADKQFLMIHVDTDTDCISGDKYCWYNATTGKYLSQTLEADTTREGRNHYSLLDVSYKNLGELHTGRELTRGGMLYPLTVSSGDLVKGTNTIQLWRAQYSREKGYTFLALQGELQVNVKSRADSYLAFVDQTIRNAKGYVSESDSLYKSQSSGVTKNKELFYQLYCIQEYARAHSEYWPSMKQSNSAAPLYTLGTIGKFIDTHVGGCEDGAVLMTLCAMRLGVSAQHQVPSGTSHKLCAIDNSETVFGKAGVTFDAQPPLTKYTMMTTDEQYNAFVNSLGKIY